MKYTAKNKLYPLLALAAGAAGALARIALYRIGPDQTGLLPRAHPLDIACWVLTAAVAAAVAAVTRKTGESMQFKRCFAAEWKLLIPSVVAALGLLVTLLRGHYSSGNLYPIWAALGFASVAALPVIGWLRTKGRMPSAWLYSVLCLFYGVHLLCCYRSWSANPQIPDYSFQLLGCVALILAAYQRCALSAQIGSRRIHLAASLMAGFLCVMCSAGSPFPWLYLTHGPFYLCDLTFRNKRRKQAEEG